MFPSGEGINGSYYDEERDTNEPSYYRRNFIKDPLYYHHRVYIAIEHETEKALLVRDEQGLYWVPKKLMIIEDKYCHQYNKFEIKYLKED